MANPNSPINGQSRVLDLTVTAAGVAKLKLAIGTKTVSGATDAGAWQGVATHEDDAAFVAADGVVAVGLLADETATDSVDEGDIGVARMTLDRRTIVTAQEQVDVAAGAAPRVFPAGLVRDDALAALTEADGDWTLGRVDSQGALLARRTPSVIVSASPTLDTAIYASGDSLHTAVISFASAVRLSGGTGRVRKLVVIDKDLQSAAGELWLFSATVTPAAANAAHSISDADAALCVGVIPFGTYYASALNSISVASPDLPINCAATTLFGILVTRGTPTYTAAGLTVALQIDTD